MIPSDRLRSPIAIAAVAIFLLVGVALLALYQAPRPAPSHLVVATTIAPLADIAKHIAGDTAEVIRLIPPGASPHSYNFTPQDVSTLQNARALFAIGHGLDDWSGKPAAAAVDVPFVVVDTNITLRTFGKADDEHEASSVDPHYWLAVPNAKIIAENIANKMIELDPDNTEAYLVNLTAYQQQLDVLEQALQAQVQNAGQKHFIAMHDAWSYFSDQYGFDLVDTYEPIEGREPSIADLEHLQALARQYNIDTFYAEPQKQSNAATKFLSKELRLTIKILDPEGGVSGRQTYAELMRFNMDQLTQ